MDLAANPSLSVRQLGCLPYAEASALQHSLRDALLAGSRRETILLLEHPHVITFGRSSKPENALLSDEGLRAAGYDVHHVNRGGDVTYHGPGQLIGYPILDLSHHGEDVHLYLRNLEGVLIDTLADFGIAARRRDGYAGVWLDEKRKIASIGVGVRNWATLHGFALNVCCELERFEVMIPCGLHGVEMTSMSQILGRRIEVDRVRPRIEAHLHKAFA